MTHMCCIAHMGHNLLNVINLFQHLWSQELIYLPFISLQPYVWTITVDGWQISSFPQYIGVSLSLALCLKAHWYTSVHLLNLTDSIKGIAWTEVGVCGTNQASGTLVVTFKLHTHHLGVFATVAHVYYTIMCMWESLLCFSAFVYGGLSACDDSSQCCAPVLGFFSLHVCDPCLPALTSFSFPRNIDDEEWWMLDITLVLW